MWTRRSLRRRRKFIRTSRQMKLNIAAALGIPVSRIGIKATTNEKMGFVGREEEIIAAHWRWQ